MANKLTNYETLKEAEVVLQGIDAYSAAELQDMVALATVAEAPVAEAPVAEAPVAEAPVAEAKKPIVVADGRSITSKKGILGPGETVLPEYLSSQEAYDVLLKKKIIGKAK